MRIWVLKMNTMHKMCRKCLQDTGQNVLYCEAVLIPVQAVAEYIKISLYKFNDILELPLHK